MSYRPTLAELEADEHAPDPFEDMTPCPNGCGARFHGPDTPAAVRHAAEADTAGGCPDPWDNRCGGCSGTGEVTDTHGPGALCPFCQGSGRRG